MDFSTRPTTRQAPGDIVLVGLAGVLLAAAAWNAVESRSERERVHTALAEVQADVLSTQARLRTLGARRLGEGERLASRQELTGEAPPPRLLAEITALLPEGVRLRSATFAYAEAVAVDLDIEARSAASWDDFLERLSRSTAFTEVRPGQEERDGEIRTVVRMTWSGARS